MSISASKTKKLAIIKKPAYPNPRLTRPGSEGVPSSPVPANGFLKPKPPGLRRRRRRMWWMIALAMLVGCVTVGYGVGGIWPWTNLLPSGGNSKVRPNPDNAFPLKPGPWGDMEYLPITIAPPDEYLSVNAIQQADRRWRFEEFSPSQLIALFQSADLTDAQRSELLDSSKWEVAKGAIYVSPSKDLVLSLSPHARKQIYAPLMADPSNIFGMLRCSYSAATFDSFFDRSGLSIETIALIKKLSYPYGHLIFFCDIPLVLDSLQSSDDKTKLVKILLSKTTLLLRLHLRPESDLDGLEHYWVKAGWGLDLRPMMESLAKLPGGARIDVVELLPRVPSSALYTYPFPSTKPEDQNKDCRWAAMNFFLDSPDQRFTDSSFVRQTLLTDYYPSFSDPRYGDIVALAKPNGDIIHLAVFIADNICYTKNSANFRDPFILMTLPDMLDHFSAQIPEDQSLSVHYFRSKYY